MKLIHLFHIGALLPTLGVAAIAAGEMRTALVMSVTESGTGKTKRSLPGVRKDVAAISAKLRELGFEVSLVADPTRTQADEALNNFGARLQARKGVGLFYFAGEAAEYAGTNYLVPKNVQIASQRDLAGKAWPVNRVLQRMGESGIAAGVIFLDCRLPSAGNAGPELAPMSAHGVFIGSCLVRRNPAEGSLYAAALADHLGTPGLHIADMHALVGAALCGAAVGRLPSESSGLDRPFYFRPTSEYGGAPRAGWSYDSDRWTFRNPGDQDGWLNPPFHFEVPNLPWRSTAASDLTLNLFSKESQVNARTFNRVSTGGSYSVGGHGNWDYIRDDRGQKKDGTGRKVYPKDLASEIKSDPRYNPGSPVTLYSCSTGEGANSFAQKLADELGAPVMAPEGVLWTNARGPDFVGPWKRNDRTKKDYSRERGFKYFQPRP